MRVAVRMMGCATLLLSTSLSASAQTVVPIAAEPDHHLAFSNDYVRVFKVEVPPKAETLYHQHDYDYLYIAIGDADVTSIRLHEKPVSIKLKNGEVELAKGPFAHKATNNSERPFRNVTIELLRGIGVPICGLAGGEKSCGGMGAGMSGSVSGIRRYQSSTMGAVFLMKSSKATVSRVTLEGKMQFDLASVAAGPSLLVAVSEVRLTSSSRNSTCTISAGPGEPAWISDTAVTLTNAADSANFILITFLSAKQH